MFAFCLNFKQQLFVCPFFPSFYFRFVCLFVCLFCPNSCFLFFLSQILSVYSSQSYHLVGILFFCLSLLLSATLSLPILNYDYYPLPHHHHHYLLYYGVNNHLFGYYTLPIFFSIWEHSVISLRYIGFVGKYVTVFTKLTFCHMTSTPASG